MTPEAKVLPPTAVVMRLVRHTESLFPPGSSRPIPRAFELSTADKDEARRRGMPALLSVFDTSRTTLPQAIALRGGTDPMTAFGLPVAGVHSIRVQNRARLRVIEDPLSPERGSGGEGHAGIEGLERRAGEPKAPLKQIQMHLADLCFRL